MGSKSHILEDGCRYMQRMDRRRLHLTRRHQAFPQEASIKTEDDGLEDVGRNDQPASEASRTSQVLIVRRGSLARSRTIVNLDDASTLCRVLRADPHRAVLNDVASICTLLMLVGPIKDAKERQSVG